MSYVTTHVLDATTGRPAASVPVTLAGRRDGDWTEIASAVTDADGRVRDLGPDRLPPGTYRLTFATGDYFAARAQATFYPEVGVVFAVEGAHPHCHVPLLLSPFAYSTYRGS